MPAKQLTAPFPSDVNRLIEAEEIVDRVFNQIGYTLGDIYRLLRLLGYEVNGHDSTAEFRLLQDARFGLIKGLCAVIGSSSGDGLLPLLRERVAKAGREIESGRVARRGKEGR